MEIPASTLSGVERQPQSRAVVWSRRGTLILLLLFVLAGLAGVWGVHTVTAQGSGQGYDVALRYAATARAGLDVPFEVTVSHPGGFPDDVTLQITGDYFDIFETQGFFPDPTDTTRDAETLYLTFAPPDGDTLVVSYDAYIQPSSQLGRDGTLAVVVAGETVASLDFRTVLLP